MSLLAITAVSAVAQDAQQAAQAGSAANADGSTLEPIVLRTQADAKTSRTGTVGAPPAPYAGDQVATGARIGMFGNRPIKETPYSVTSLTAKLIRDQQARSIADITINDPSVRQDASVFSERDAFFIRGFSVTNLDTLYDGLPYIANPRRSFLEGIERVEILKGPTVLANGGTGRVGGTINLVPKRAADEPLTRLTTTYMSDSQFWNHLDVGRRFGADGEWGVRVNGSYRFGDTAYDHNDVQVGVATIGLDYRGDRLRASLDIGHNTQNIDGPTSLFNAVAPGVQIPDAPDGDINAANPWEYHDSTYNMVAGRVEYDLLDSTTIYAAAGASRYREDFLTTSYTIGHEDLVAPGRGDALAEWGYNPQEIIGYSGEVGLRSEFDTGSVGHQLNLSYGVSLNKNNRAHNFHPGRLGFPSYPTNIYNPIFLPDGSVSTDGLPRSSNLDRFADLLSNSIAISDTLSFFDDRFLLKVGGRYQDFRSQSYNTRPGTVLGERNYLYEDSRFSPSIAALFNVTDQLSVYANYVEALTEPDMAPSAADNAGEMFPAVVSRQKEIGVKYDLGTMMLTASLFEIRQPNGFTDPATNIFSMSGKQVNRGVELSAYGEPVDGVRLLAGVTFLDAELAETAGGALDGNRVPGVARTAFSVYGEYDTPFVENLTLTGRVIHSGSTYYDEDNTQKVDGWTRLDLGARYVHERENGKPIEFRANVENVLDENYWASSARGYLAAGAPRTFMLSTSVDF